MKNMKLRSIMVVSVACLSVCRMTAAVVQVLLYVGILRSLGCLHEVAHTLNGHSAPPCVVGQLVFAYLSDAEMHGSGVREHQSRYTGVGHHHAAFGQGDAYLAHVYQVVDDEVDAHVGH